jgi:hypothetical protein
LDEIQFVGAREIPKEFAEAAEQRIFSFGSAQPCSWIFYLQQYTDNFSRGTFGGHNVGGPAL